MQAHPRRAPAAGDTVRRGRRPLAHPVRPDTYIEINNFYTATVYEKGAELMRMIETILGPDDFRRGMDLYFDRHDGEAATIEDFLTCFEDACGRDLVAFQALVPSGRHAGARLRASPTTRQKVAELEDRAGRPADARQAEKKPLHIPVKLALLGANGDEIDLKPVPMRTSPTACCSHQACRRRSDSLTSLAARAVAAARLLGPGEPHHRYGRPRSRVSHGSRSRWLQPLAGRQHLCHAHDDRHREGPAQRRARHQGRAFAKALGAAIADPSLEPAYRAELLKLPSQSDIAREIARNVDPSLIFRAHRQLQKLVGTTLGDTLEDIYREMKPQGAFSPDAASAGRRALRNATLTLLAARGTAADEAVSRITSSKPAT